jgi:hypothetical protein
MSDKEKSVYEVLVPWATSVRDTKKKTLSKKEVVDLIDKAFKDKQTVEVNIEQSGPVKFEGLTKEQISVFLKIFDGYKADLESKTTLIGKAVAIKTTPPTDDFQEVKPDNKPRPTPTI